MSSIHLKLQVVPFHIKFHHITHIFLKWIFFPLRCFSAKYFNTSYSSSGSRNLYFSFLRISITISGFFIELYVAPYIQLNLSFIFRIRKIFFQDIKYHLLHEIWFSNLSFTSVLWAWWWESVTTIHYVLLELEALINWSTVWNVLIFPSFLMSWNKVYP
jgi:hypothetical protein